MLSKIENFADGKKSNVVSLVMVVLGLYGVLTGDVEALSLVEDPSLETLFVAVGLLGLALRDAIKKATK